MFCGKCGAQVSGNGKFCPKCGAPLAGVSGGPQGAGGNNGGEAPKKKIPYLAIAAIVVIALILVFVLKGCFTKGYEKPVKNFVTGVEKQNIKKVLSAFPEEYWTYMEENRDWDREELEIEIEDALENGIADDYDGKVSLEYEIRSAKDCTRKELKDLKEKYENYNMDVEIKDAKDLKVRLTLKVDGDKEEGRTANMRVIKIGSKWYLDFSSANMFF